MQSDDPSHALLALAAELFELPMAALGVLEEGALRTVAALDEGSAALLEVVGRGVFDSNRPSVLRGPIHDERVEALLGKGTVWFVLRAPFDGPGGRGVLLLAGPHGRTYREREREQLMAFAHHAGAALAAPGKGSGADGREGERGKEGHEDLIAQTRLLENLVEIARTTAEGRTLTQTLDNTLAVALTLTGGERATLFLFDDDGAVVSAHHASIAPEPHEWRFSHQPTSQINVENFGLAAWCVRTHRAALVPDVREDDRWTWHPETPAASALAVPLLYGDKARGVLTLVSETLHFFTLDDRKLMEAAASQIALSLESALLLEAKSRLVEELSAAKESAEAANRAKTTFLSSMSHELRTPLSVIIGYTELMREINAEEGNSALQPTLDKVLSASRHLLAIINDMLDLSKIEAGRMSIYPTDVSVRDLVETLIATVQPLLDQNDNRLEIDLERAPEALDADPTRLRQILINLLSNAAKFTERGSVTLRVEEDETGPEPIVCFRICDTGIGIPAEALPRIFDPFMQVDDSPTRRFGGTGLGLPISRRLAILMGGDILVESELGVGSTFTVCLPRRAAEPLTEGF